MAFYSPIILFIYKRPEHLRKTLQSLSNCNGYENFSFFVFGDGPKNQSEEAAVLATRKVATDFLGDKAQFSFAPKNRGLGNSVINGVNKVLNQTESAIIIEDDLIFHPDFLAFMNTALNRYSQNENVSMVSGYMYNVSEFQQYQNQIFLPLISTWGWGTWSRSWKKFDPDAVGYEILKTDRDVRRKFDCNGSYPFSRMLELQMRGKIDSWGIRWYWSIFKSNGVNCFPPNTLVLNEGFDSTATHGRGFLTKFNKSKFPKADDYKVHLSDQVLINVDSNLYRVFCKSMYHLNGGHIGKIRDILKRYLWDPIKRKK